MKGLFKIKVKEQVYRSIDCWDAYREVHYTKDIKEEVDNYYNIELEYDEKDYSVLSSNKEILNKLDPITEGKLISFDVVEIL